jgi:CheY-like chemotaxis protein
MMITTILVIEDDAQIRRIVQGYLQQAGYRTVTIDQQPVEARCARSEHASCGVRPARPVPPPRVCPVLSIRCFGVPADR